MSTDELAFEVATTPPEAEEFCALRVLTGLSAKDPEAARLALPKSLFAVTIRNDGRLIAMGRVVGDGLHVQVVDIAVDPDQQGRGLSRIVMQHIMDFIATLPRSTIVSLFADVDWLYQKFGFGEPTASTGMFLQSWPEAAGEPPASA